MRSRTQRSSFYNNNEYDDDIAEDGVKKNPADEAAERLKKYEDNKAERLHEELKQADNYMDKVTKTIKLSELYEIADYYYTSESQKICPVLLKIKHDGILYQENGFAAKEKLEEFDGDDEKKDKSRWFKYLLQIWRKSDASMLYERKLREVPMGWGLQTSDQSFDMFFYQEADEEDNCEENRSRIYCFAFREAKDEKDQDDIRLHAFKLPLSIKRVQT